MKTNKCNTFHTDMVHMDAGFIRSYNFCIRNYTCCTISSWSKRVSTQDYMKEKTKIIEIMSVGILYKSYFEIQENSK